MRPGSKHNSHASVTRDQHPHASSNERYQNTWLKQQRPLNQGLSSEANHERIKKAPILLKQAFNQRHSTRRDTLILLVSSSMQHIKSYTCDSSAQTSTARRYALSLDTPTASHACSIILSHLWWIALDVFSDNEDIRLTDAYIQ